jgi:hypothetical protein
MGVQAIYRVAEATYKSGMYKAAHLYREPKEPASPYHEGVFGFDPSESIDRMSINCHIDDYRLPRQCLCRSLPASGCQHLSYKRRYIEQARLDSKFE